MKRYAFMLLFFIAALFLANSAFSQRLRPVTIGLTGKSLATAAFEMSIRKGHFKKEGLDVKFITIRQSDVIIKAIMAGELNFMSIIPTAILASVRGLPIRTIAVNLDNAPLCPGWPAADQDHERSERQKSSRQFPGRHEHPGCPGDGIAEWS